MTIHQPKPMINFDNIPGAVAGAPRVLLRLEGAAVLAAACVGYAVATPAAGWSWFAALFLVPDVSMLGYLAGRRIGAVTYNVGHSYVSPAMLALLGWHFGYAATPTMALIWVAHIGFDRMMGYGLKYASGFGDTHLGRKGRRITPPGAV
jgi:hypothetical protein